MEAPQQISDRKVEFKSYSHLLDNWDISYHQDGAWLVHGRPIHDNTWIICLSISLRDSEQILNKVLPYIKEYGYSFVVIKDQLQHNRINNNAFPASFFGKALMIYPKNLAECNLIAKDIADMTEKFDGLHIPECIRLGSIVYVAFIVLNLGYNKRGNEAPFKIEKVNDKQSLFPESEKWKEKKLSRFIKNRYLPIKLIKSSFKGNILKGLDILTMRWVFIKQARPWATEDIHGRQMRDRLLWQKQVSEDLEGKICLPRILDYVEQEGYSYLITEYIKGISLESLLKDKCISSQDLWSYYLKIVREVEKMHLYGYVHRDITPRNILIVEKEQKVYLSDFELAHNLSKTDSIPFEAGTKGYMSPQQILNLTPTKKDDVFSLGAMLYYLSTGLSPLDFVNLNECERARQFVESKLQTEICDIIDNTTISEVESRISMEGLMKYIQIVLSKINN